MISSSTIEVPTADHRANHIMSRIREMGRTDMTHILDLENLLTGTNRSDETVLGSMIRVFTEDAWVVSTLRTVNMILRHTGG